jgi:acyl transferase domain-containing protein
MVPIAAAFAARVARVALSCPRIPVVSSMTGAWLSASEATDPQYWARQLRQPVRFAQALSRLDADLAILDIGPGRSLAAMTLAELGRRPAPVVAVNAWPPAQRADMESMLAAASRLWCSGVTLDWASFHGHGRKLPLPTYAFEPQRHWIERAPRTLPKEPDVRRWLYASAWQRSLPARPRAAEPILVLSDADEPSAAIIEALRAAGAEPIAVRTGSALDLPARGVCTVVPGEPSHFDALLQQLAAQGRLPWHVAHLWCVGPVDAASQDRAFYSLLNLAQAYAALRGGCSRQLRIDVVSTGVHDVGGDGNVDPDKALLLGPVLVVPQEIPAWSVRSIDLGEAPQDERAVSCVVAELLSSATDSVVALRGASRFVRAASPLQLSDSAPLALRDGGLYLVTGGLGGVGLCFARHLGQRARIRLLLTGRSEVPARAAWPQAWLDSARTVETAGSLFIPERADAADAAQMRRVLALAESRHGPVRGVIHAAAVAPGGAAVLKARSAATEVLRPKLEGVRVLESVLNPRSLDFFVLCSSVSSVQGGLGLVDYCAANAFLDAYAQQRRHRDATRVISVSWDGWRDVGMSADARIPLAARAPHQASSARAMTTSEGCQVLDTVLGLPLAHVIVSTHALEARLADSRVAGEVSVATSPGSDSPQREEARPRTATEQVLQQIWQALFGMPAVGIHDDFFELGGHSLIALRLVARVDAAFNLSVAPRALFDAPTIAGLAAFVDAARSPAEREREEFVV